MAMAVGDGSTVTGNTMSPRDCRDYRKAVERYRMVWKKYLSEEEMYMLNDWDSLYKIIILLKRKFADDTRSNYL